MTFRRLGCDSVLLLTHRVTFERESIAVVDEPIEDGVGDSRIFEIGVPLLEGRRILVGALVPIDPFSGQNCDLWRGSSPLAGVRRCLTRSIAGSRRMVYQVA